MLRCIIIDDEPHAILGLQNYIEAIPELKLLASYTDPVIALKEIHKVATVDIIFMDIDMPKISGIELAKEIRSITGKLVFTTAHTKYAYEAFEANADAYLLKPYTMGKFVITINKLFPMQQIAKGLDNEHLTLQKNYFFVKSKEDDLKILKINFDDVVVVESKLNYVMIYTPTKKILTYMSLVEIAKILVQRSNFKQLHRSFLINTNHIETIDGNLVKMINGTRITVGEHYRKEFNAFINDSLIKAGKLE